MMMASVDRIEREKVKRMLAMRGKGIQMELWTLLE